MADKTKDTAAAAGVATPDQNARLEHSRGGRTTRDDPTDLGAPMLQGDPSEPVGPEDALGEGRKRGDYRNLLGGSGYNPTQTVRETDDDGNVTLRVLDQRQHAEEIGDEAGVKGGVDTAPRRR